MRIWACATVVALVVGCSGSGNAPTRYRMSGTVTLAGKPIPYGEILFTPDGSKKNTGPQGIAPIRDGKYDTGLGEGKGIAGGPTILRVNGMTGPGGKTLCEYELPLDLPHAEGTKDIDVPKPSEPKGNKAPEI